jgi:type IV pilus assembly protein PilB
MLKDVFVQKVQAMQTQDPLLAVLEQQNLLDAQTLQRVAQQHEQTGQGILGILKKENLLNDDQLVRLVAAGNGIEFVSLSPDDIDPVVAHLVSYDMANRCVLIPVRQEEGTLVVAMSSPMHLLVRDQIEMKTGYKVVPVAATATAIREAIHCHFDVTNVTKQAIASMRLKEDHSPEPEVQKVREVSDRVANDPVTRLVASIVRGAIDARASDIHIEPQESELRVRYRVDGILRAAVTVPSSAQNEVVSHIKILSGMDISEKRLPQDGHMSTVHSNRAFDLRVSSLPSVGGEKVVIRILDKSANKWDLDAVVLSQRDNAAFRRLVTNPYGMILVTGPTGCGKTTTLYSLLQLLNTMGANIVTVEDPVEYRVAGITQVQVKPVAGLTFASALRSILRQDPDIILIGEIRDGETAEIAVSAALTGHLVLSTLHTNDAAGAISRLTNLGIPPFLAGSAMLGAVAQRLVRNCCPKCRQQVEPTAEEWKLLTDKAPSAGQTPATVSRAVGCADCYHTGYKGRRSIYEILAVSSVIRKMIVEGQNDDAIAAQGVREGMRTLYRSALDEVLQGTTTLDEVSRVVDMRDR